VQLWGRTYPVLLPSLKDPRLHVAAVIFTLQILGQTVLGFRVSIAQILVCLVSAALIEFLVGFFKDRVLMWPASGLLTGNSIAFILRVPGTVHGQWWSLRGTWVFLLAVALSMASKYLIRRRGQHLFNPSNLGLVACFIVLGPALTEPQDLWWMGASPAMAFTYAVILVGGALIGARLKLLAMEMAYLLGFAAFLIPSLAFVPDHCMTASWAAAPLCGTGLWTILVTSPEVLVFAFFMLSDPKTVPVSPLNRVLFGLTVGFFSALLLGPTATEFWTKTALLASLVVACAIRFPLARLTRLPWGVRVPGAAVAGALCLALLPLSMAIPARNPQLVAWLPGETTAAVAPQVVAGPGPGVAAGLSQAALSALPPIPGVLPQPAAASSYVWKVPALTVVIPKQISDFDPGGGPPSAGHGPGLHGSQRRRAGPVHHADQLRPGGRPRGEHDLQLQPGQPGPPAAEVRDPGAEAGRHGPGRHRPPQHLRQRGQAALDPGPPLHAGLGADRGRRSLPDHKRLHGLDAGPLSRKARGC